MKKSIAILLLFIVQVELLFRGVSIFGKYVNVVLLFTVSMLIPFFYFRTFGGKTTSAERVSARGSKRWMAILFSLLPMLLCGIAFYDTLCKYPDASQFSDVLPQLHTLYSRFVSGTFPYTPVQLPTHTAFPVYMPLHWLPVGIAELLHIDIRWTGFILLLPAVGLWGLLLKPGWNAPTLVGAALPAVALYAYLAMGGIDLPATLETVIAAYYLLLAAALMHKNMWLVTLGLILCLLSRYTLIFWLPVFAFVLLHTFSLKKNLVMWASVATAIIALYIIPFLSKDPTILLQGIEYHNHAAVEEWIGYDSPRVSYSFETGIYFAPYFKKMFTGSMEQRVLYTRIIQGALMLLLNAAGILYFRKRKNSISAFEFLFVLLYLVLAFFYFFGPLTYRYYLFTLLLLSAAMTGRMLAQVRVGQE